MPLMPQKTKVTFQMGPLGIGATLPDRRDHAWKHAAARVAAHSAIRPLGNGKAQIFMAPDFLTPDGCARLMELIEAKRRPSTVANHNGDNSFRTSETCDMDRATPVVSDVQNAIAGLLGIPMAHAETLQGQRYAPGQQFKLHPDYFEPDSDGYRKYCATSGQRTWTAMAYLNDVEKGGETVFPELDLTVVPKRGTLLMWNNLHTDGTPNRNTMHQAKPVEAGIKAIITEWFRELPWT